MSNALRKLFFPPRQHHGRTGMDWLTPIDEAHWIWHPDCVHKEPVALRFRCGFRSANELLRFHITADERYVLFLDGKRVARGPDRSDVAHWCFASYEVDLDPGEHLFEVVVWKIGEHAPKAQVSYQGGLLLRAEGAYDEMLTTGKAGWEVLALGGIRFSPLQHRHDYLAVGDGLVFDGRDHPWDSQGYVPAKDLRPAVIKSSTGVIRPGWLLFPTTMPDQIDRVVRPGSIRAVGPADLARGEPVQEAHLESAAVSDWQALVVDQKPVAIPARTEQAVLWDLEDYYCAYPQLTLSGGRDSRITWGWEEGLYEEGLRAKGNRNEVLGKRFVGLTDTFIADGGDDRTFFTHWWRSGRYVLLCIKTADEPLLIQDLAIQETRYPVENESTFSSDDADLRPVIDLCVRGVQMCAHETYMDCPYYEQLMYVGDTRLEVLTHYVMARDCRLPRRAIELFGYSRRNWGFVNERYPSYWPQLSCTFSLIWVLMLHDYYHWRDEIEWVRSRMVALRSMLEHFEPYRNADGLLEGLPGWSFMDWVPEWDCGNTPSGRAGVCCIINLLYAMALERAAALEDMMGEALLAERLRRRVSDILRVIRERFWNEARGLFADDLAHEWYSEHAQCFALLTGTVTGAEAERVFENLISAPDLKRTTVYFSFYLLEAFRLFSRGDLIVDRLDFWKGLVQQGFRTPVEMPEPSRSDCHAWGSHPLFHLHASVAGVRPAAPGFRTVSIAPLPGRLTEIQSRVPHPAGEIAVDLRFHDHHCEGTVVLPAQIMGTFRWQDHQKALSPGEQTIRM